MATALYDIQKAPKPSESFNIDIAKFARQVEVTIVKATKKIALEIYRGVIYKTPVDTGRLRANWTIGRLGAMSRPAAPSGKLSKRQASSVALSQIKNLAGLKLGEVVTISNNLPYAVTVEYGKFRGSGPKIVGGYSKQAPAGMVRITLAEVAQNMDALLNKVV
jgi:hypothetical protein